MAKYRIVKTDKILRHYWDESEKKYWYKLEKRELLMGWYLVDSGYFAYDSEATIELTKRAIYLEREDKDKKICEFEV